VSSAVGGLFGFAQALADIWKIPQAKDKEKEKEKVEEKEKEKETEEEKEKEKDKESTTSQDNLLEDAAEGLKSINKRDIVELKAFAKPPQLILDALQALFVLITPQKELNGKLPDWAMMKKKMSEATFLQSLTAFDRSKITLDQVAQFDKIVKDHDLSVDKIRKASLAVTGLFSFAKALTDIWKITQAKDKEKEKEKDTA